MLMHNGALQVVKLFVLPTRQKSTQMDAKIPVKSACCALNELTKNVPLPFEALFSA
jgi:hypothetical protein